MSLAERRIVLSGGVSCEVAVECDAQGREIVVKQALAKLRVRADWRADPRRAGVEADGLRAIRELLGPGAAPEVLWEDPQTHRFAMRRIDPRLRNWRDELSARRIDLTTAARAGELLGLLHARSALQPGLAARFADRTFFEQLRIEPFFVRVAQRNPPLAAAIGAAIAQLRAPGAAFVHGDYSPKNMLVDGAELVMLDCEPAHWGDPRFDVGFCLMHLILDGWRRPPARDYLAAAQRFVDAYAANGPAQTLDAKLVRIIGCLMLARLEGDSPIDYLHELDVAAVKRAAVRLISEPVDDVRDAVVQAAS